MKQIDREEKALEYLVFNPEGNAKELRKKISLEQINLMERSGVLEIGLKKYKFNQKGIDYYCDNYKQHEKANFLGL